MWTKGARIQHAPRKERYPSDMTDTEWAIIAPLIPPQRPGGRHRETDMREVMNAVRYVLRTGCQWRQLPKDFPPRSTVYNYFWEWTRYGVLDRIHHMLLVKVREMEGREASPTGDPGQHPGPRLRCRPDPQDALSVSMDRKTLCRWRLCRSQAQSGARRPTGRIGNRQAHGQRGRIQGGPPAVGNRANIILAATQSTSDGPLRSIRHHRRRLRQARNDMHHAQAARRAKAQPLHVKFRVRL